MESRYLVDLSSLTMAQKTTLAKGKIQTVSDLLLHAPSVLANRCRMTPREMEGLVDLVCKELYQEPQALNDVAHVGEEKFTTGDAVIDDILGGGMQTGMLWEISGENNAGKTQLALQLALAVQLPLNRNGASGSACYVSTRGDLRTERLQQIVDNHPILSPQYCGISGVFTLKALNFAAFIRVVNEVIPRFANERASSPRLKPPRLVVIDTFSDLFDASKDPEYENFKTRARDLKTASLHLHRLATTYQLAVVILCSTRVAYARTDSEAAPNLNPRELLYSEQQQWFSRAHTVQGEDAHESILGHLWPNQVNARIMMSRTARTRPRHTVDPRMHDSDARAGKRRRIDSPHRGLQPAGVADESVPFRRLSVIFSSVAPPASCDYVILDEGVVGFPQERAIPPTFLWDTPVPAITSPRSSQNETHARTGMPGSSVHEPRVAQSLSGATVPSSSKLTPATGSLGPVVADDDDDMYWNDPQDDRHPIPNVPEKQLESVVEAQAESGPPADGHAGSDSDYYWQDDADAP